MQTKQELLALLNLQKSMAEVSQQWTDEFDSGYPSDWKSFDEMAAEGYDWITKAIDWSLVNEVLKEVVDFDVVLFEYYGQEVKNPFYSTCLRFKVDPVEHYGWYRIRPIVIAQLNEYGGNN